MGTVEAQFDYCNHQKIFQLPRWALTSFVSNCPFCWVWTSDLSSDSILLRFWFGRFCSSFFFQHESIWLHLAEERAVCCGDGFDGQFERTIKCAILFRLCAGVEWLILLGTSYCNVLTVIRRIRLLRILIQKLRFWPTCEDSKYIIERVHHM